MPRYAAIDIGSNSIRMQAAELEPGSEMRVLASERVVTRLGESVFRNGAIAQQYQKLDVVGVRAVATSAVRDSRNQAEFVERASPAIGAPVEIISGSEEARLIHLGVQARWPHPERRLPIVDIGGGSAELISSEHGHMRDSFSKLLGAVRLRETFLQHDPPLPSELHQMHEYIEEKRAGVGKPFGMAHWDCVAGTSATASALVCAVNRIPRTKRDQADRMRASTNEVRRLYYSAAGVRDDIIADLDARGVGRELAQLDADQRKVVIETSRRYGVALPHARKVAGLAHVLFTELQPLRQLPPHCGKLLEAAYLHDAGHCVADASHHKHSYYLVSNSDMSGFTNHEREQIANLCRYHRKSMPVAVHPNWQSLHAEDKRVVLFLIPLPRLADNLDVSHECRIQSLSCRIREGQVVLQVSSSADISLEQWAAQRAREVFRQVYNRTIATQKVQADGSHS